MVVGPGTRSFLTFKMADDGDYDQPQDAIPLYAACSHLSMPLPFAAESMHRKTHGRLRSLDTSRVWSWFLSLSDVCHSCFVRVSPVLARLFRFFSGHVSFICLCCLCFRRLRAVRLHGWLKCSLSLCSARCPRVFLFFFLSVSHCLS